MPCGRFSAKFGKFNGPKAKQDIFNKPYATEFEFLKDVLITMVLAHWKYYVKTNREPQERMLFSQKKKWKR